MPRWMMPISAIVMTTVAAIALAAQFHPDAPSKVILKDLVLPAALASRAMVATQAADTTHATAAPRDDDASDQAFWREERIIRGDTVLTVLARLGIRDEAVTKTVRQRSNASRNWRAFVHSDEGARALYRLLPDKTLRAKTDDNGELLALRYLTRDGDLLQIDQDSNGNYRSTTLAAPTVTRLQLKSGEIQSSLFGAADQSGIPDAIVIQMAEIFSGDIDFFHDLRKGDRFTVAYEMLEYDGQPIKVGRVLAAEFVNRGMTYRAFHYAVPGDTYANESGMLTSGGCRPLRGLCCRRVLSDPGVPLRCTPGFMLTPAPQAENLRYQGRSVS